MVRPYAVTRGRTRRSPARFDLVALVVGDPADAVEASRAWARSIVAIVAAVPTAACRSPRSPPDLDLPLGVVRVLLGDLLEHGLIAMHEPPPEPAPLPDERIFEAVINGLRAL